jgi:hypothetical protein
MDVLTNQFRADGMAVCFFPYWRTEVLNNVNLKPLMYELAHNGYYAPALLL